MMKTLKLILITLFVAVSCSNDAEIKPRPEIIPYPAEIYGQIVRLSAMLQEYAGANRIKYVDYHSAMKDDHGGLSTELAKDGVHPTREGYDIMKSLLLKALK